METEQLQSNVQARHDKNSSAANTVYVNFIDALDASLDRYVKAKGLEFPEGKAASVFRNGQKHYHRMRTMARYGADDLKDILKVEMNLILEGLKSRDAPEVKLLMHVLAGDVGRYVHSYPSRLSTLIDNLHLLVASYYEIDVEGEFSITAAVGQQLAEYNRDLKYHLQRQVVKKDFTRLRNAEVHKAPDFMEWMEFGSEAELPQVGLNFVDAEPSKKERAFDHLFPFYERTLETSARAVELLLV